MKQSIELAIYRDHIVPEGKDRVTWLERWGIIPEAIKVAASAELSQWDRVADVGPDGKVVLRSSAIREALVAAISARLRDDPTDTSDYDATSVIAELATKFEAAEAERQAEAREEKRIKAIAEGIDLRSLLADDGSYSPAYFELEEGVRNYLGGGQVRAYRSNPTEESFGLLKVRVRDEHRLAVKTARIASVGKYVLAHPEVFESHVVRAASEGRDVVGAVRSTLTNMAQSMLTDAMQGFEDGGKVVGTIPGSWELDARAPRAIAYAIRDKLVSIVPAIEAAIPDSKVTVSDFGRGDISNNRKETWRSMLDVIVHVPVLDDDVGAYVMTEPYDEVPSF